MCVILVCPPEVRPSLETLRLCSDQNPHGAGIAWRSNGAVEWLKTDDVKEIHSLSRKLKGEIVIHFRIASVGAVCPELRHPFPINRTASLAPRGRTSAVLFQNGTWSDWTLALRRAEERGYVPPAGPMNDTRAAAWLCRFYGHKFLNKCGSSRWLYFSSGRTVLYGRWQKHNGILFSNLYWQLRHTEPPRSSQNVSKTKPDDHSTVDKSRPETENPDLWDMACAREYWRHLDRVLPKPRKS